MHSHGFYESNYFGISIQFPSAWSWWIPQLCLHLHSSSPVIASDYVRTRPRQTNREGLSWLLSRKRFCTALFTWVWSNPRMILRFPQNAIQSILLEFTVILRNGNSLRFIFVCIFVRRLKSVFAPIKVSIKLSDIGISGARFWLFLEFPFDPIHLSAS